MNGYKNMGRAARVQKEVPSYAKDKLLTSRREVKADPYSNSRKKKWVLYQGQPSLTRTQHMPKGERKKEKVYRLLPWKDPRGEIPQHEGEHTSASRKRGREQNVAVTKRCQRLGF